MTGDWKDALAALRPEGPEEAVSETEAEAPEAPVKGQVLCISFQRRAGKPATILSGWEGSPERLRQLAAELKSALAAGGSVRDDEILLQGDVRDKVRRLLTEKGYKTKGG